jgi:UDP-glucose 6-dehydrogenase
MCIAAFMADIRFKVVEVDVDKAKVEVINGGSSLISNLV